MISDILFSLVLIVLSIIWIIVGIFDLNFWIPGVSAGSGFVPTVFAATCLLLSVVVIISALRKGKAAKIAKSGGKTKERIPELEAQAIDGQEQAISDKTSKSASRGILAPFVPVLFSIAGIFSLTTLGVEITVFVISIIWLMFVSRISWKSSLIISIVLTLFVYLVFVAWLKVPFPRGIINF